MEIQVAVQLVLWIVFNISQFAVDILHRMMYKLTSFFRFDTINNGKRARVLKIICRFKFPIDHSHQEDFIALHGRYDDPMIVLQDNISLYCLSKTEATFVITPPGVNIYSSNINSFLYECQFNMATHLVILPMNAFHEVANKIGKPRQPLVMLQNSARCGSTLIVQALETVPGILCLSEPTVTCPERRLKKHFSQAAYEQLMVDIICILCKPRDLPTSMYCIKTRSICLMRTPVIARNFPNSKQLFMTRDGYKTVDSLHRAFEDATIAKLSMSLKHNSILRWLLAPIACYLQDLFLLDTDIYPWLNNTDLYASSTWVQLLAIHWASLIALYKQFHDSDIAIPCVLYEDIVKDPELVLLKIFKHVDIPEKYLDDALVAFKKDSQRDQFFSREVTSKKDVLPLSYLKETADCFNLKLNVSLFGEPLDIPGLL